MLWQTFSRIGDKGFSGHGITLQQAAMVMADEGRFEGIVGWWVAGIKWLLHTGGMQLLFWYKTAKNP